jgi:DNA-binding GntR family transcriptional regulator
MKASKKTVASPPLLIKSSLAVRLKNEIIRGNLPQGSRIVEKFWASKFGVTQTSVREAINILIAEGFATKNSGAVLVSPRILPRKWLKSMKFVPP